MWLEPADEEVEGMKVNEGRLGVGISNMEVAVMSQVGSAVSVKVVAPVETGILELSVTEVDPLRVTVTVLSLVEVVWMVVVVVGSSGTGPG